MLSSTPRADPVSTTDVHATWLIRLRWLEVAGEAAIILGAPGWMTTVHLPVTTLLVIVAVQAASNALLAWRFAGARASRAATRPWCGSMLVFDTLALTALLFFSSGPANPFSVFYLVLILVSAVALGSAWTWFVSTLAVGCYAVLFAVAPLLPVAAGHEAHNFAQHLQSMWVALTLAAALTAYFVTRLTALLARRDEELARMRELSVRHERLASLTTLAAGAAHELGTPLATVAVSAGELDRALRRLPADLAAPLADDVQLIRTEVQRCRQILDGMAAESGDAAGEMPVPFTTANLVADVVGQLRADRASRVKVETSDITGPIVLPRRALGRAVMNLVRNALDAAPKPAPVALRVTLARGRLRIEVEDTGPGMPPEILRRAGEPFFTTKAPGEGLGLGLFLVRSLAEMLGGQLTIDSLVDRGTVAVIDVPAQVGATADV